MKLVLYLTFLININVEEMMKGCTSISGVIEGKPGYTSNSINEKNKSTFNQNGNMNNYNQQRSKTFLDPYGNDNNKNFGNNNYNNNNYASNPYFNSNFDISVPDPFKNELKNEPYYPCGNNNNNNNFNTHLINPYNQGNDNLGDNPFDHPNI